MRLAANSRELMTMVGGMMSAGEMGSDMTMQMLDALLGHLKEQNSLLANHPNSYIYHQLGAALEIDGHFLALFRFAYRPSCHICSKRSVNMASTVLVCDHSLCT